MNKDRIIRLFQGALNVEKFYGKNFSNMYEFLQESQWWSEEKLKEYQLEKLKNIIVYAYENVPYYKKLFDKNKIDAYSINRFEDIKKIPYLTKEIIKENINDLYNINYPKYKIEYKTTGGSTGTPMGLYQDRFYTRQVEQAFVSDMWSRVGYDKSRKQKIVYLRGIRIKNKLERNFNNLILNGFLLTEKNYLDYLEAIKNFKPDFINGYPSMLYILSKYIVENNVEINMPELKAILLTSENVYDFQREVIEKAFKVRTYSFYGHTERACIGGECEKSTNYHITPQYGYTEFINEKGEDSKIDGEYVEIVCTGFINPVMPFIRYKTQDIAINSTEKCSCGRNYKIIKKIEGRAQDFVFDNENNMKSFTCQDEPLWSIKDKIVAYQYIQEKPGEILLNIQPKFKLTCDDISNVESDFKNTFNGFNLKIELVDEIKKNHSGKFRYLEQKIKNKIFI